MFQAEQEKGFARCARQNATTPFAGSLRTIETCHVGELYWQATGRRRSPSRKWPRIVWYSTRGKHEAFPSANGRRSGGDGCCRRMRCAAGGADDSGRPRPEQAVQRLCRRSGYVSAICRGPDSTPSLCRDQSGGGGRDPLDGTRRGARRRYRRRPRCGDRRSVRCHLRYRGGRRRCRLCADLAAAAIRRDLRTMHGRAGQPSARLLAAAGDTALCRDPADTALRRDPRARAL